LGKHGNSFLRLIITVDGTAEVILQGFSEDWRTRPVDTIDQDIARPTYTMYMWRVCDKPWNVLFINLRSSSRDLRSAPCQIKAACSSFITQNNIQATFLITFHPTQATQPINVGVHHHHQITSRGVDGRRPEGLYIW